MLPSARILLPFLCLLMLAGCANRFGQHGNVPNEKVLKEAGEKLGVDLTSPLLARQSRCYDKPFEQYSLPQVGFRAICYENSLVITSLFWVRSEIPLDEFIRRNVDAIAKDRASDGFLNTDKKSIQFLELKDGVAYHSVRIGNDYTVFQGTLVIEGPNSLGLKLGVMVKAREMPQVVKRMEDLRASAFKPL